ncbi:hypothetical protein DAI22_07g011100 [Oryza sativa Japonica Group]|nr:hypothetical protein DAI22_07g011100 [Oryza sativa Japonica Group]
MAAAALRCRLAAAASPGRRFLCRRASGDQERDALLRCCVESKLHSYKATMEYADEFNGSLRRAMFGMTALSVLCPFVGLVSGLWASSIALTDDDDDD